MLNLLSVLALVLCDRFGQAKDMVHKTSEYYTQLTSTISARDLNKWKKEITSAESRRLENPSAMDLIGVRQVGVNAGSGSRSGSNRSRLTGVGPQWLDLALSIEERQYVFDA